MMKQMLVWSKHEHWGVRAAFVRRLPSAFALGDGFAESEERSDTYYSYFRES